MVGFTSIVKRSSIHFKKKCLIQEAYLWAVVAMLINSSSVTSCPLPHHHSNPPHPPKPEMFGFRLNSKKSRSSFMETFKLKVLVGTWNVNSKVPNILYPNYNINNNSSSSSSSSSSTTNLGKESVEPQHADEFTSIPIGTNNGNGVGDLQGKNAITSRNPLDEWLHLSEQPDVIAIGLQEIDMTAEAMLKKETQTKQEWIQVLESELQCSSLAKMKYQRLSDKQLVGMFCCVFVAEKYQSQVRDVQAVSLALGAMGVMGNKGAVGIRLKIADTTMCFVTTHLAPHMSAVQKRNQNFIDIFTQLEFARIESGISSSIIDSPGVNQYDSMSGGGEQRNFRMSVGTPNHSPLLPSNLTTSTTSLALGHNLSSPVIDDCSISAPSEISQNMNTQIMLPDQHDYFFWFGDLNYRIDNMERNTVEEYVKDRQYKALLDFDQLTVEKMSGRVFMGFKEGRITFPPTYKYDPGTLVFDTSEKRRVPSYTDRILWKGVKRDSVKQLSYMTHLNCLISDHLPVSSVFETDVQMEVDYKFRQCKEAFLREYDQTFGKTFSQSEFPVMQLSATEIHFEDARFSVPQTATIILKNIGQVVSEFFFVKKGAEDRISEDWLTVSENHKLLVPGESIEIELTCCFNSASAPPFNLDDSHPQKVPFEDILVIHVDNGKDYPVKIYGNYMKSCFGNSLNNLVQCFTGVRDPECKQVHYFDEDDKPIKNLLIPKELFFMCDHIVKYGLREEGLFQVQGTTDQIRSCRELLDNGLSLSKHFTGSIHSVCSCLIQFFESLVEPIIPGKLYRILIENSFNGDAIRHLIDTDLAPSHFNTWNYILNFLREVLLNSDANGLTPDSLAQGFADVLVRSPKYMPMETKKKHLKGKIIIIKHFFTKEYNQRMVAIEDDNNLFKV